MFCGYITAFVIRRDVKQQTNKQRDACTCTQRWGFKGDIAYCCA